MVGHEEEYSASGRQPASDGSGIPYIMHSTHLERTRGMWRMRRAILQDADEPRDGLGGGIRLRYLHAEKGAISDVVYENEAYHKAPSFKPLAFRASR